MSDGHIPPGVMAELADGTSRADRDVLLQHLASCPRCAAVYAELVSHRAGWLRQRDELPSSAELVRLGLAVPGSMATRENRAPRSRRAPGRRIAIPGLAATAVVAVLVVLWWWPRQQPAHPAFVDAITSAVERRMSTESIDVAYSAQVASNEAAVRTGAPRADELSASLVRLADYYNNASMTADVAYWLVGGYIATGQMRNAEAYLDEALEKFPADARIELLAGILEYKQSDLDGAERHFRSVIEKNPRDGVAHYNLGVVLSEQGRGGEAGSTFARAETLLRGTPLAGRAARQRDHPAP